MKGWTMADVQAAKKKAKQPTTPRSKENWQALGRLPGGERNKTEAAYERLLQVQIAEGTIMWYGFECVNLRLGKNCFYEPDFLVMRAGGGIEVHEVKGFWTDDALVKFKATANSFPFRFLAVRMSKGKFETILEI